MATLDPRHYTVAWIAPLEIEARAAKAMFDGEPHPGRFAVARGTDYLFIPGTVAGHNVVIATLPPGTPYGSGSAGALAGQVKILFPNLWFGLLVGVATGLPVPKGYIRGQATKPRDIRLGDVLVGLSEGEDVGILNYSLGKSTSEGFDLLHGGRVLASTESVVRSAIGKIKLDSPNENKCFLPFYESMKSREHTESTFEDPGQANDRFFSNGIELKRDSREPHKRTRVWYGKIGSGERLEKNATERDELRDRYGLIGLEMAAAGTMNTIPVGVVRAVCDYGDEHDNKEWQPFAAAMAAAFAKAVLTEIPPRENLREDALAAARLAQALVQSLSWTGKQYSNP